MSGPRRQTLDQMPDPADLIALRADVARLTARARAAESALANANGVIALRNEATEAAVQRALAAEQALAGEVDLRLASTGILALRHRAVRLIADAHHGVEYARRVAYCAFCGEHVWLAKMADHMRACAKHPLRAAEQERDEARAAALYYWQRAVPRAREYEDRRGACDFDQMDAQTEREREATRARLRALEHADEGW